MAVTFSPGDVVGCYQLVHHVHSGAFGQVWVGRHVLLKGYWAVKLVPLNGMGNVELDGIRRYKTLAEDHAGLVAVEEFGRVPNKCYFYTMQLADDVKGKADVRQANEYEPMTLERFCQLHRPLPIDRLLAVALHLLPSLHALHEAGFVHRDVKLANVVRVRGTWKLCDMGLLARRDEITGNSGTPWFMPPEGAKDRRADLYAFGKTLFLLATDLAPGAFPDFMNGMQTLPGSDDRRDDFTGIIQRACHEDPGRRFQTALEMYQAIKRLVRRTKVTVALDDEFASFTPEKLEEFIAAVREKGFNPRGDPACEEGSVRITLELMPDEAERLAAAVEVGEFARFRAVRVEFANSPPGRAPVTGTYASTRTAPKGKRAWVDERVPDLSGDSVAHWIEQLKAGNHSAAQPLWERYYRRLVQLARAKLRGVPRRVADEEDIALSAFNSFCEAAATNRFPQLLDRDDLWHLLVVITARKAHNLKMYEDTQKRGGGKVIHESALPGADSVAEEPTLDQVIGREPTPEFAAQVAEEYEQLLGQLDDELRLIALWKLEGYTTEEIADKLSRAPRTVRRKLQRIRDLWAPRR